MCACVAQLCPTLCLPCTVGGPPGSSVHGLLQARILEWVAILLQGIFPRQGWKLRLPHFRQILYCLSHQGSPQLVPTSLKLAETTWKIC